MANHITQEEINRQKGFLYKIKEISMQKANKTGHMPVAVTKTYGCQQNENDTERIEGMLIEAGYVMGEEEKNADLVIYNTCAVRENAEMKVFGRIGILKHMKENGKDMIIGLCGCMVQQEHIAEKIKKTHRHIDMVFGTHALYRMPEILYKTITKNKTVIDIEQEDGSIAENLPINRKKESKAWVSIMYGCNNFCSYCIVPYVRGRERSREPSDIIAEIEGLVKDGVSEVTLLGQNVNSYGKDLESKIDFSDLLRMVNEINGIERIRFMTSHPKDFGDKLLQTMVECPKICRQLHLPVQAGSNRILKDMNRRYTKEEYLEKIEKVKKAIPGILLTTDVIVGYPKETVEDFEETLDVIRKVEYDNIYSFIYSRRKGTPAAKLDFVLTEEQIHENFNRLLEVQNEISKKKNDDYVGRVVEVLVDGVSKNNDNTLSGRTETSKIVNFVGDESLTGKYVKVKITEAHTWSLNGELAE